MININKEVIRDTLDSTIARKQNWKGRKVSKRGKNISEFQSTMTNTTIGKV